MPRFIDVGNTDKSLLVDIENLTCVRITEHNGHEYLSLNDDSGSITNLGWGVKPREALAKILAAKPSLIPLNQRFSSDSEPTELFIAAEAVTFITTSVSTKDGKCGMIAGVKGLGWTESHAGVTDEVNAFINAVKAHGKAFLEFNPDEASALWSFPSKLYIDPASIIRIRADRMQLNVSFENSYELDITTRETDISDIINDILDTMYAEGGLQNPNIGDARKRADIETLDFRNAFAAKLATANGKLTSASDETLAVYIRPQDLALMSEDGDKELYLLMKKNRQEETGRQIRLTFASAAARNVVIERLTEPKPPQPSNGPKL